MWQIRFRYIYFLKNKNSGVTVYARPLICYMCFLVVPVFLVIRACVVYLAFVTNDVLRHHIASSGCSFTRAECTFCKSHLLNDCCVALYQHICWICFSLELRHFRTFERFVSARQLTFLCMKNLIQIRCRSQALFKSTFSCVCRFYRVFLCKYRGVVSCVVKPTTRSLYLWELLTFE